MKQHYQWTDDEDAVATDAVTVSISSRSRILRIGGLEFGDPVAWVYWPERHTSQGKVAERTEGPFEEIRSALAFAEETSNRHGFRKVVVALQDRSLWKNSWGMLASSPGLD